MTLEGWILINLRFIASRIAGFNKISYGQKILELVSDEIRKKYGVLPDAEPFEEGVRSAVFINSRGNVVAFFFGQEGCNIALESVGQYKTTLPEVYDIDTFNVPTNWSAKIDGTICVIEMEKLEMLSKAEIREIEDFANKERIFYSQTGFADGFEEVESRGEQLTTLLYDVWDLVKRAKSEGVYHADFHSRNYGRGEDGKLKFIDWESVMLD